MRWRRGLTFVELTIGVAISAIIMLALATFSTAVSTGWRFSEEQFKLRSATQRSVAQLNDALSQMLCVVQTDAGGKDGAKAYFFCWAGDTWGGTADLKAQFGEMALIEFEPASKTIWLYRVKSSSALTAQQKVVAADDTWGDYTSSSIVTYFKSSGLCEPRRPLVGGAATDKGVNVLSTSFGYFKATNGKPVASYQLALAGPNAITDAGGNVPMRAAQQPTNLTFAN